MKWMMYRLPMTSRKTWANMSLSRKSSGTSSQLSSIISSRPTSLRAEESAVEDWPCISARILCESVVNPVGMLSNRPSLNQNTILPFIKRSYWTWSDCRCQTMAFWLRTRGRDVGPAIAKRIFLEVVCLDLILRDGISRCLGDDLG
jgi:hypothetical protein